MFLESKNDAEPQFLLIKKARINPTTTAEINLELSLNRMFPPAGAAA
jgi:hypothetical protein